jgi:hypothetical protein
MKQPSITALTRGPQAHFFGYYDKSPWDRTGRFALALEADDRARLPLPGEKAGIVLIECATGQEERLAETSAWNWQQGCQLQWLPPGEDHEIIFNDSVNDQHVAVILDIHTGRRRVVPRPIVAVDGTGRRATSVNFARLARTRPVVGYASAVDSSPLEVAPADDGLWVMDLASGASRLVFSLAEAVALKTGPDFDWVGRSQSSAAPGLPGHEQPGEGGHRFDGAVFNPGGTRIQLGHHWPRRVPEDLPHFQRHFWDRVLTLNVDGTAPRIISDEGFFSHSHWRDDTTVLAWARCGGRDALWELDEQQQRPPRLIGADVIREDGHCSYSPDRCWIVGDSYPDAAHRRCLWIYSLVQHVRHDLGRFESLPPYHRGPVRCDLHPRWSRDGRQLCIDSIHEGTRQMYLLDVSEWVDR